MPKAKSHKGSRGRFKITGTGKVIRKRPGKSHLMSSKSAKRRRHLRRTMGVFPTLEPKIKRLLDV